MDLLLTLLVFVVIAGLAYWAIHAVAGAFGLPPKIVVLVDVLLVIIFVVVLLRMLVGGGDMPTLRLRG